MCHLVPAITLTDKHCVDTGTIYIISWPEFRDLYMDDGRIQD